MLATGNVHLPTPESLIRSAAFRFGSGVGSNPSHAPFYYTPTTCFRSLLFSRSSKGFERSTKAYRMILGRRELVLLHHLHVHGGVCTVQSALSSVVRSTKTPQYCFNSTLRDTSSTLLFFKACSRMQEGQCHGRVISTTIPTTPADRSL